MRHLLGSLALGCCSSLCLAAEPVAAVAPPTVDSLVQKLGSDSYAEREAAGAALLKLGPAALDAVKLAAASHADLEVRERAAALVEPMAKASDSSKLLAVKTVKIGHTKELLTAVISDFKTKTGIPLLLDKTRVRNDARLITIPAGEYAPWEALEVVLKAAGLREDHRIELPAPSQPASTGGRRYYRSWDEGEMPNYNPSTAPIVLVDGVSEGLPASRGGAVRITALPPSFSKNRVIRGAGRIEFHLDVAPQPGLGWNSATGFRVTHAEDEDGRPVFSDLKLAYDPMASNNDPWNGGWGWGGRQRVFFGGGGWAWTSSYGGASGAGANDNPRLLTVSLRTNDRAVAMLRKFEGVVTGDVHTPNVPVITIDNLEAAHGRSFAGPLQSNLTIEDAKRKTDGSFTLKFKYESLTALALQQQGGGANQIMLNNDNPSDVLQRIKYYDADGKALPPPVSNGSSSSSDGFRQTCEVTYTFKKGVTHPVKMVIHGTKVSAVEVPFSMVNVRVP